MGAVHLVKVPQRYKEQTTEMENGYKVTTLPIEQASYAIEFDFDLKIRTALCYKQCMLKTYRLSCPSAKNTFQAKTEDPIPYATAIKMQEILLRPSILRNPSRVSLR